MLLHKFESFRQNIIFFNGFFICQFSCSSLYQSWSVMILHPSMLLKNSCTFCINFYTLWDFIELKVCVPGLLSLDSNQLAVLVFLEAISIGIYLVLSIFFIFTILHKIAFLPLRIRFLLVFMCFIGGRGIPSSIQIVSECFYSIKTQIYCFIS